MFRFFKPKQDVFRKLIVEQAALTLEGLDLLKKYMGAKEHEVAEELTMKEKEADEVRRILIDELNRTFVTPFDREDIALLAHSLDDVTDLIHAAADTMLLYKVKAPGERVRELADIIVQIASVEGQAMPQLRQRSAQLHNILDSCVEINRLENVADRIYRSALTELFDNTTDIADVIKWREIYEYMESATDSCEDVADVLEGVALKYA